MTTLAFSLGAGLVAWGGVKFLLWVLNHTSIGPWLTGR